MTFRFAFCFLTAIALVLTLILYPYGIGSDVLDPKGLIALKERDLMYISTLLMLIVVIPVFILTFAICWRYRATNKSAEYDPNWNHDTLAEAIWWGFPCLIIAILSVVTWKSSHELDPYKPLQTSVKPIKIQVVALQWKWLFIYPEQKIATLNFFQFPEQTPLEFEITADAPMNSFWIPQLGGQIYAMPGMNSRLNLISSEVGDFRGSSANLSGDGFASMHFIAKSSTHADFNRWVEAAQNSPNTLDKDVYRTLALPSENNPTEVYVLKEIGLFNQIIMRYMMPPKIEASQQIGK